MATNGAKKGQQEVQHSVECQSAGAKQRTGLSIYIVVRLVLCRGKRRLGTMGWSHSMGDGLLSLSLTLIDSLSDSHSQSHSHTLTTYCTCCYDEIKGAQDQDLFSCSFSDSLSETHTDSLTHSLSLSHTLSCFLATHPHPESLS